MYPNWSVEWQNDFSRGQCCSTLIKGPFQCRLGSRDIGEISNQMVALKDFIPCEFARKPRSMKDIDRWKATEFKQLLLYTGPVVLSQILHPNLYKHFLLLFVGIHILINT